MDKLLNNDINNVRNSVDIVDVISEYVPLISRGKNFLGVCPFHDDNHPSMSVSREKQIYTCFSCGATGNVFNFLMDYKSISFKEALKMVADRGGVSLDIGSVKEKRNPNVKMYEIYDIASKFYQNNINTSFGKKAKEYLKKRDITDSVIKEFDIGLSLKKQDLLCQLLTKKGYTEEEMIKSGLINRNDYGLYDMYYDRIMFPLYDTFGKIVGFSGRIFDKDDLSKYINTKETDIFKKGELLYNYHRAKEEARKEKKVIIMEGFMDVIRAYTIGVKNVVASMGTAITKEQALLLKRLAPEIILCFDGDKAGEKATISCIEELEKIGIIPKVVRLEDNLDPDEYIVKNGKDKFLAKINEPINIMDFKISTYKKNVNLEDSIQKSDYIKKMLNELLKIDDEILKELTIQKISVDSNLDMNFLKEQLKLLEKDGKKEYVIKEKKQVKYSKYDVAQKALIYYMLKNKDVIKIYNNKNPYLPTEKYRLLAREIVSYYKINGIINVADLITELSKYNSELISVIGEIESCNYSDVYKLDEINDYINVINEYNIKLEANNIKEKIKLEPDPMKRAMLAQKMIDLKRKEDN